MNAMASQLNRLVRRRRSKKTSKLRVTGLCEGNSPVAGEFPTQKASYAKCFHLMTSSWSPINHNSVITVPCHRCMMVFSWYQLCTNLHVPEKLTKIASQYQRLTVPVASQYLFRTGGPWIQHGNRWRRDRSRIQSIKYRVRKYNTWPAVKNDSGHMCGD